MTTFLDLGHGPDNRAIGVFDPGAVANGEREADVVREVAYALLALMPPGTCTTAKLGFLPARIAWQRVTLGPTDLLVSLHMNAGGGTGVEVFYAATKPELRKKAMRFSRKLAYRMGFRDRGAKTDEEGQHPRLGILRVPLVESYLVEVGFLDNLDDLKAVHAGAAKALAAILTEGI